MLAHGIPSNRNWFTGADLEVLAAVLAADEQRLHLEKLGRDPEELREMLDLKEVLRGLLVPPAAIQISPLTGLYPRGRHRASGSFLKFVRGIC